MIRIFAAMGWATDLKTITTSAVKNGLSKAVDTGKDVVNCILEANEEELAKLPKEHYLIKEQLD